MTRPTEPSGGVSLALSRDPVVWTVLALAGVYAWGLFSPEVRVIVWPDSIAYLIPAADALEFGYFSHAGSRAFVYPGFLWLLLAAWGDPSVIATAQRAAAYATFVALAAIMIFVTNRLRTAGPGRLAVAAIAGFWLAVFVLYPPTAGLAHVVGPETLASLLLSVTVGGIVLIASPSVKPTATLAVTAITIAASTALAFVRPHWQLAALLVPPMLPFIAPRARRRPVIVVAATSVFVSLLVFVLPESALRRRYDPYLSLVYGPRHLFCSNADLIHQYFAMSADDAFSIQVRESLARILTTDARAQATDWALLGFNSDLCTHGETARIIAERFGQTPSDESRYYVMTYLRALAAQPTYLPARIARNFAAVALRPFPAVATDYWVRADDRVLLANVEARSLFREWAERYRPLFSGQLELPSRRWPLGSRLFFAGSGMLLVVTTALAVILLPRFRRRGYGGNLAGPFAVTLVCAFATNGLIAVVHTFEPRYLAMQAPMFVMLGFLATVANVDALSGGRLIGRLDAEE